MARLPRTTDMDMESLDAETLQLSACASQAVVRALVDFSVDVEAQTQSGETPLHLAAERGHRQVRN